MNPFDLPHDVAAAAVAQARERYRLHRAEVGALAELVADAAGSGLQTVADLATVRLLGLIARGWQ